MPTHGQAGVNETSSCDVSRGLPLQDTRPIPSLHPPQEHFCFGGFLLSSSILPKPSQTPKVQAWDALAGTEEAWASDSELLLQPTLCLSFPGVGKGNQSILWPRPSNSSGWGQRCPRGSSE